MDDQPDAGFPHRLHFAPRNRSLRRQLLIWVLLPQLVLWGAGGVATYRLAVRYVNQAADATLSQASRALARRVKPMGSGLLIDFPRAAQDILETDPNDRLFYTVSTPPGEFVLGNSTIPIPPTDMAPRLNEPYFYDGEIPSPDASGQDPAPPAIKVRIAALYMPYGEPEGRQQWMLVQVARGMAHRQDLFKQILLDTLLPLSGLIPLLTMIVWVGTGAGLKPLLRLRKEVEGRSPADLAPLQVESAPQEVRSLVQALNDLLASVRQNVNAQKRFIADAAHQLRTPLAGLKSQTALAMAATDDPLLLARLKLVDQSAARGAHLISQLLMLARADPDAATPSELAPLDVVPFVREIVAEYVPRALRAGIDLGMGDDSVGEGSTGDDSSSHDSSGHDSSGHDSTGRGGAGDDAVADRGAAASGEPLRIDAHALLLREAVANVIDNAIKYTGRGGEITVRVVPDGADVLVIVSDNGPGIALDDRARVFERFVRATDHGEGCGLGLAIVRDILTLHGGAVTLQDARPRGLQVELRLPRRNG